MALYKYLTKENLKRVLGCSIRFTQPGAFNDPFEMVPELYVPDGTGSGTLNLQFSVTAERRSPPIGDLPDDFQSDFCHDLNSRGILDSLNESVGILCLSKNPESLLMWSHYADEYSGGIIEFDDSHEFFTGAFDIEYREVRPKKDISTYISSNAPIPISELCVKSKEWEYEEEVRVVRSFSECKKVSDFNGYPVYVMEFPIECIKCVVLGERMPIATQREIWQLVKDTKISLSLAAISNRGYEFRKEQIKYNEPVSKMPPVISPRTAHVFSEMGGPIGDTARFLLKNHPLSDVVNRTL